MLAIAKLERTAIFTFTMDQKEPSESTQTRKTALSRVPIKLELGNVPGATVLNLAFPCDRTHDTLSTPAV